MSDIEDQVPPGIPPLHVFGGFGEACGYRTHTLAFARALARRHPVRLRVPGEPLCASGVPEDLADFVDDEPNRVPEVSLGICGIPDFARLPGRLRIGYTVFETTRLPSRLLEPIKGLDQIWVPSHWCRDRLIANGVEAARIHRVPEGVDTTVFAPRPDATPRTARPFRFLCVGKWEPRKCQQELIRTFIRTFGAHEDVELVIHGHNPFVPGFSLEYAVSRCRRRAQHRVIASHPLPEHRLADLYRSCDAMVLPTRGEAWGLPITEAMASGLPVITTAHGGPLDFVSEGHAFPLPVAKMRRVRDRANFHPGRHYGHWAEPDWDALSALMRHLVEHPEQAMAVGRRARHYAETHLTWDIAARQALISLAAASKET